MERVLRFWESNVAGGHALLLSHPTPWFERKISRLTIVRSPAELAFPPIEPFEARVQRRDDVQTREADLVRALPRPPAHFRRQDDVAPARPDCPADHHLRLAVRVDVGGVDEVDPAVDRPRDDGIDGGLISQHERRAFRQSDRHHPVLTTIRF
jgi:hypothetical protein